MRLRLGRSGCGIRWVVRNLCASMRLRKFNRWSLSGLRPMRKEKDALLNVSQTQCAACCYKARVV